MRLIKKFAFQTFAENTEMINIFGIVWTKHEPREPVSKMIMDHTQSVTHATAIHKNDLYLAMLVVLDFLLLFYYMANKQQKRRNNTPCARPYV